MTSDDQEGAKVQELRSRLRQLAEEKATLHLVLRLIERLDPMLGIENLLLDVLTSIVDTIGGTDIQLFYWDGPELHRVDISGANRVVDEVDDPLARQVAEGREIVEQREEGGAALLEQGASDRAFSWGFPLLVGGDLIGIIAIKNTPGSSRILGSYLPVFFDHAALVLASELRRIERERAEENLRKLSLAVAQSPASVIITDTEGTIEYVNPKFVEVSGYGAGEVIGRNPRVLKSDITPPSTYTAMWDTISSGKVWRGELCNQKKNGDLVWESTSIAPIFDASSRVTHYVAVKEDISERKRAETYLGMEQEILRILNEPGDLRDALDGVLTALRTKTGFDAVGIRLQDGDDFPYFVQDGFPRDFLAKENSLVERDRDGNLCRDEDGEVILECTCGMILSGKADLSSPFFTKGGSCWSNDSLAPVEAPAGQDPRHNPRGNCVHYGYASVALVPMRSKERVVGLIHLNDRRRGCFSPRTIELLESIAAHIAGALLRKQAEKELAEYRDHLEELVDVRTSELKVAKEAAEAANRAKSAFLSNMSHELRTPLNAILGFSQIMTSDPGASPEQKEHLAIVAKSGEHLLDLINDVLDLSKIESGTVELETQACDLGILVNELVSMLRSRAEAKGLRLLLDQSSSFPRFVKTDTVKLRQVLINLIGNAIKFTEQGHVSLKLSVLALNHGSEDAQLRFEVSDTGPGIAPEDQSRIFDAFYQSGSTGGNAGSGLGLAISREYVKVMGGSITVDSTVGEGSTFSFTVDFSTVSSQHIPNLRKPDLRIESIENAALFRILIVEDQLENRLLLNALLAPFGFQLREALDGREALAVAQEWRPHVILMDRRMPILDGLTATREIRALSLEPRPVIIAVTAHAYSEERQEMLSAGCDGFLRKPFQEMELFELLAAHLDIRIRRAASPRFMAKEGALPPLAPEAFIGLPEDLRGALEAALRDLDMAAVATSVAAIRKVDPVLGERLEHEADRLAYDEILRVLKRASESPGR